MFVIHIRMIETNDQIRNVHGKNFSNFVATIQRRVKIREAVFDGLTNSMYNILIIGNFSKTVRRDIQI